MITNVFERILFAQKVTNDNIVVLNEKVDMLMKALSFEDDNEAKEGELTTE